MKNHQNRKMDRMKNRQKNKSQNQCFLKEKHMFTVRDKMRKLEKWKMEIKARLENAKVKKTTV